MPVTTEPLIVNVNCACRCPAWPDTAATSSYPLSCTTGPE